MLNIESEFPQPGSKALFDGRLWRVQRLNADGSVTISADGPGASFRRDAPLDDLTDPKSAIALRPDADLAVRLALAIRHRDGIGLGEAMDIARDIHDQRLCRTRPTPNIVRGILADLGWKLQRTGGLRSVYLRSETTLHAAGEAA